MSLFHSRASNRLTRLINLIGEALFYGSFTGLFVITSITQQYQKLWIVLVMFVIGSFLICIVDEDVTNKTDKQA